MNNKRIFFSLLVLGALLVLSAGFTLAQESTPPAGESGVLAPSVDYTYISPAMSYQGRLVENGVPANGNRSMIFRLYRLEDGVDPPDGLELIWVEGPNDVQVVNGLFHAVIGDPTSLPLYTMGVELWLEIIVDGTALPAHKLYGAPYALGLAPGVFVRGDMTGSMLKIHNKDESSGIALDARSSGGPAVVGYNDQDGIGVWGTSISGTGVHANSGTGVAINAAGTGVITSAANSYVFVPAIEAVFHFSTDHINFLRENHGQGYLKIIGDPGGIAELIFPVTLPSVLYGQAASVEQVSLSFNASDSSAKITRIQVFRSSMSGTYLPAIFDDDNDGNGWESVDDWFVMDLFPTSNNTFTEHKGYLAVRVFCDIPDGESIFFTGVRLRLGHE